MDSSETTSTTACKWFLVCINKQDGYRSETSHALVKIIVFREESQVQFELLSEIF